MSDSINNKGPVHIDHRDLIISPNEDFQVTFEEKLLLVDSEGQVIDKVTVAVENNASRTGSFLVYQYSQNEVLLLRVKSDVYRSLDSESEVRRIKQTEKKKVLRIFESGSTYTVFMLVIEGRNGKREIKKIPKSSVGLIILEGANIILLRKIATSRLLGQFTAQTINQEGELCLCEYEIENGESDTVRVRRTVTDSQNQEVMTTLLSRDGRIRFHRWSNNDLSLVSSEPQPLAEDEVAASEGELSISEPDVKADKTAYFEKKEALIQMMKAYLLTHTDVQDMIADFVKDLLFEKPDDLLDFADCYFSELLGVERFPEEIETPGSSSSGEVTSKQRKKTGE